MAQQAAARRRGKSRGEAGRTPAHVRIEIPGILVAASTLLLFLALISYRPPNGTALASDWIGPAGATLADALYFMFGLGAFSFILVGVASAVALLVGRKVFQRLAHGVGAFLFVVFGSTPAGDGGSARSGLWTSARWPAGRRKRDVDRWSDRQRGGGGGFVGNAAGCDSVGDRVARGGSGEAGVVASESVSAGIRGRQDGGMRVRATGREIVAAGRCSRRSGCGSDASPSDVAAVWTQPSNVGRSGPRNVILRMWLMRANSMTGSRMRVNRRSRPRFVLRRGQ